MRQKIIILFCLIFLGLGHIYSQTVVRGKIKENGTKTPIENAKISISNQGIGVISNDAGYFSYRKHYEILDENSILTITAPGYKSLSLEAADIRQLFGVVSSIYLDKDTSTKQADDKIKNVKLFWEASAATDFNIVWEPFTQFIDKNKVKNIQLIVFSDTILEEENFKVSDDLVDRLEKKVSTLKSQKISNYDIVNDLETDGVFLVSDGKPIYGEPSFTGNIPVYSFLTGTTIDLPYFEEISKFTNGEILNKESFSTADENKIVQISGVVRSNAGPIQGALISKKGSLQEFYTTFKGEFVLPADEGDILVFNSLGMYTKSILIEDVEKELEVFLQPSSEILDEVLLSGKKNNGQDELVETAFRKKSKEQLGTQVGVINEDDINDDILFLGDLLRGRFAGVSVTGFGQSATISIRNSNSQSLGQSSIGGGPLWVVDGALFDLTLGEMSAVVNPQNIKSISVLKSANAAVRYGSAGANGVIIIKTKNNSGIDSNEKPIKSLLIKGNEYMDNVSLLDSNDTKEDYIKALDNLPSLSDKFERFLEMERTREPTVPFYIDMALYFNDKNVEYSNQILDKLILLSGDNSKVLRIISFVYESSNQLEKAKLLYERILKIAPRETQSYRDLAMIYQETGEYNKSLEMYINILGGRLMGIDFSGIKNVITSELRRLIAKHKSEIEFSRLPNEFLTVGYNIDLRMTLQWSDYSAPFEFQFVNPNKKYYKWAHTLDQNKERLFEEKKQGYQMEEFIIDDAPSGDWLVNIEYIGDVNSNSIPPYLKYVLYQNFGTPQESKKVKVVKLYLQKNKITLDNIKY